MPTREKALIEIQKLLPKIAKLYKISPGELQLIPDYEGCQNLVYFYDRGASPAVLRISFRDERGPDQILAELDFIRYLHDNGVRVSPPVPSANGRHLEVIASDAYQFAVVSFERAPGHRLPDMGYRYRDGAAIEEYWFNWGRLLGQMHRLARDYSPEGPARRPQLVDTLADYTSRCLAPSQAKIRDRFQGLLEELEGFPKDDDAYGLIHADFNDGNFCIDYTNGNITVFDFDDSAYCWFMYDLADAWRNGMGWTMAEEDLGKRRSFMDRYFDTLLSGYAREHALPESWLKRLPTFLKMIEMEAVLSELRDMSINGSDKEWDGEMAYQQKCVEEGIPFFGFFDSIYSPSHPFELPHPE